MIPFFFVQMIFYQFLRFKKNFYFSVYQWEFFEVARLNTGFYGGQTITSMHPSGPVQSANKSWRYFKIRN